MYRYYSKPIQNHRVTVVGEHQGGVLKLASACCSNKDQFIKKKGRAIAEGRLHKNKLFDTVETESCDIKLFVALAENAARQVAITKVPVIY